MKFYSTIFRKRYLLYILIISLGFLLKSSIKTVENDTVILIEWFNNLKGDFSFASKWSFAENIGLNKAQQIACFRLLEQKVP
jgi:hypothetical protein